MQPEPSCAQICASPTIGQHGLCQLMRADQKKNNLRFAYDDFMYGYVLLWVALFVFTPGLTVMIQIVYLTAFLLFRISGMAAFFWIWSVCTLFI
jgi:hypothetical protein